MKNVLEEVDQALKCVPVSCPFRFLDIGSVCWVNDNKGRSTDFEGFWLPFVELQMLPGGILLLHFEQEFKLDGGWDLA